MAAAQHSADPVVVTGLGVASAIGVTVPDFWRNLLAGRAGCGPVQAFDASDHPCNVACEVREELFLAPPGWRTDSAYRASALLTHAAIQAMKDADLPTAAMARTGLCVGSTMGESGTLPTSLDGQISPAHQEAIAFGQHVIALRIKQHCGLGGPLWTLSNACAAGNYAIAQAVTCLRAGEADVMLAGGVDALSWVAYAGFESLRAMATERCQPFSLNRQGLVLGEGAGALVLERLSSARRRGAPVYAEVVACGFSCDAHHIAQPHHSGRGATSAMLDALRQAGLTPDDVDYISAHGTGTRQNDRSEALAIHAVFGARAATVPVSSIKAQLGHSLGAASALEAIACCLALRDQVVPGTHHFEAPDPECQLDMVPNAARPMPLRRILSNAYAFGGNNTSLVLVAPAEGEPGV